ncbi:MAG: hypothetical protein R3F46_11140 [bacterium]
MISRRLTATIAIPLCALSIALLAMFPLLVSSGPLAYGNAVLTQVLQPGISLLANWVFAVILGAVIAAQLRISGAAERLVRYTAEYAGEDRFRLGLSMLLIIAVLFTTLGGLGAVILVASICLPVLFSLGIERRIAGGIFLLGLSLGGALNPTNWQGYQQILTGEQIPESLRLELTDVIRFGVVMAALFLLVSIAYLLRTLSTRQDGLRNLSGLLLVITGCGLAAWGIASSTAATGMFLSALHYLLSSLLLLLLGLLLLRLLLLPFSTDTQAWTGRTDNWLAAASLLLPILLLLWSAAIKAVYDFNSRGIAVDELPPAPISIDILAALTLGIIFCALSTVTRRGKALNQLMQALFEGVQMAAPAVILLIGIGILLKATRLEAVTAVFEPVFAALPVSSPFAFILTFFLLSPLALYRGPLNLYGMGITIMGILTGAGVLHGSLIMAAFFSVGMLQGVCDPTNTHNVWIANFCKVPVNELTRLLFPWVSIIVLLGLIAGAVMFRADFPSLTGLPGL